jgi:hypothetical protein
MRAVLRATLAARRRASNAGGIGVVEDLLDFLFMRLIAGAEVHLQNYHIFPIDPQAGGKWFENFPIRVDNVATRPCVGRCVHLVLRGRRAN